MKDDRKYVIVKAGMLSQNELNRLIDQLNIVYGFSFIVECEVYTANNSPITRIDILNDFNDIKKKILPFDELFNNRN